jgi:hypothetical protein
MKKIIFLVLTIAISLLMNPAFAKSNKKKSHAGKRVSRHYKKVKKSKKTKKHGNGPDLKDITNKSDYKEAPTNGVNPVENK